MGQQMVPRCVDPRGCFRRIHAQNYHASLEKKTRLGKTLPSNPASCDDRARPQRAVIRDAKRFAAAPTGVRVAGVGPNRSPAGGAIPTCSRGSPPYREEPSRLRQPWRLWGLAGASVAKATPWRVIVTCSPLSIWFPREAPPTRSRRDR